MARRGKKISKELAELMREMARKGGRNSRKNLSDDEKTALAKKAAAARWRKK